MLKIISMLEKLSYFNGAKQLLSLYDSYAVFYGEPFINRSCEFEYYSSEGITTGVVVSLYCAGSREGYLEIIINSELVCAKIPEKYMNVILDLQDALVKTENDYMEDQIENFEFLIGKPFFISIDNDVVNFLKPIDCSKFISCLPLVKKLINEELILY